MAHTPGPWTDGKTSDAIISQSSDGLPPYPHGLWQVHEMEILGYYGGHVIAESVAPCNKPLIKAAPDLLDACKGLLDFIRSFDMGGDWCQDNYPAIKAAQAAIAKARGKTS